MAQLPLLLKKEVLHVLELKVKLNSRQLDLNNADFRQIFQQKVQILKVIF